MADISKITLNGTDYNVKDANAVSSGDVATQISAATSGLAESSAVTQEISTALSSYTPTSGFTTINGSAITSGGNITISGGSGETVIELTQTQYDALTAYSPDTTYIITDATPVSLQDYATTATTSAISADVATVSGQVSTLSGTVSNKADKASVSTNSGRQFPRWNTQGIVTGTTGNTVYEQSLNINGTSKTMLQTTNSSFGTIYAPTSAGTQNTILMSNGSGAPSWSSIKMQFISQSAYNAITTKDANTIYFIISEN